MSKLFSTYCDAVISVLLSIFAAFNVSAIGLILFLLSVVIFVATPKTSMPFCISNGHKNVQVAKVVLHRNPTFSVLS